MSEPIYVVLSLIHVFKYIILIYRNLACVDDNWFLCKYKIKDAWLLLFYYAKHGVNCVAFVEQRTMVRGFLFVESSNKVVASCV